MALGTHPCALCCPYGMEGLCATRLLGIVEQWFLLPLKPRAGDFPSWLHSYHLCSQQGLAMQFSYSFINKSAGRAGRWQSRAEEMLAVTSCSWSVLDLWCLLPAMPRQHWLSWEQPGEQQGATAVALELSQCSVALQCHTLVCPAAAQTHFWTGSSL